MHLPADYLADPQAGIPIALGGMDAFGRVAVTGLAAPPVAAATTVVQPDTMAAVLVPLPPTGIDGPSRPPQRLITLSASPNPFHPAVRIAYTLPREASVTVSIHDAAGRLVEHFEQGRVPGNETHAVFWDGTTRNGHDAASGVYFVRVETPYDVATMKIVRMK
jgi:hypothetical protein